MINTGNEMTISIYRKCMADVVSAYEEKTKKCGFENSFRYYIIFDNDKYTKVKTDKNHALSPNDMEERGFSDNAVAYLRYIIDFKRKEIYCYTDFEKTFENALQLYYDALRVKHLKVAQYYLDCILNLLD